MTTKKSLEWRILLLILAALPCCRTLEVSIPQREYEAAKGGEITMACSFIPARPIGNALVITWEAYPDTVGAPLDVVATYFINNPIDIAPDYEGRASMEVNVDTQVSTLTLTKLTMQDSRNYQCSVIIPNDDEGTTAASTSLLVLVAPSTPICGIQGEAEYWHNISLTCSSAEGSPKPVYQWQSYSVDNVPRQFPPRTTEKDGALSLFNISRETSGFFVCTSSNRIGSASCNFTLAVMPTSMNIGSTAGILVGVFAAVVLLGIIIFCCCCKKKDKKEKYIEGEPAFYDRDTPEAGEQYWDDKSTSKPKQVNQHEDDDIVPQSNHSVEKAAPEFADDQQSYYSNQEKFEGKGSDYDSGRNEVHQHDRRRGSQDRLEDQAVRYGGSRDRLDDQRDAYRASGDRPDDRREGYRGSRDRLDDERDRYRGSRDRLDERNGYRGSHDRLDDERDRNRGSRDRLEDERDRYRGSRDRLDDQRDGYRGSQDRLDDQRDRYRGSREHLDDRYNSSGRSHDVGYAEIKRY